MSIEELKKHLHDIGVDFSEKKLRRLGEQGFIKDHEWKLVSTGRGNEEEWSDQSFIETAALWAVRRIAKKQADKGARKLKKLSAEETREIKLIAKSVFESPPRVFHEVPSEFTITTPDPEFVYDFRALKTKVVQDGDLNDLVITWIAAREKARLGVPVRPAATIIVNWWSRFMPGKTGVDIELKKLAAESAMRGDGIAASKDVPDWHIHGTIPELSSFPKAYQLELKDIDCEPSHLDHDELLVFFDGTDSRKKAFYAPFDYYSPTAIYGPDDSPLA
jgi:hypothetical protein